MSARKVISALMIRDRAQRDFGASYPEGLVEVPQVRAVMNALNDPPAFPDPDAVRAWVRKPPRRVVGQLSAENREVLEAAIDRLPTMDHLASPKVAAILLAWNDLL
jgi:hypothetical protein